MTMKKKTTSGKRSVTPWLYVLIAAIVAVVAVVVACIFLLHYTYGKLNIVPTSAAVKYRDDCKVSEDDGYGSILDTAGLSDAPSLTCVDGVVKMEQDGYDNPHITYIFTGEEKCEDYGTQQWYDLLELGKRYPNVNGENGWVRVNSDSFSLTEAGWYTVFAIWYENGEKQCISRQFNKAVVADKVAGEVSEEIYEQWKINKDKVQAISGTKNYLFVGTDVENKDGTEEMYSDTILLVTVNHTSKKITTSFVSKELFVYIPGIGCCRLTDAYYYGGIELLIKTVEENLGIKIHNYCSTDYKSFIHFVNALGGINITIAKNENKPINAYLDNYFARYKPYEDASKEYIETSGEMTLDGLQALAYLRYYGSSDFSRGARYQSFLRQAKKQIANVSVWAVVNEVFPQLTTDLTYDTYVHLLFDVLRLSRYEANFDAIPSVDRVAEFKEDGKHTILLAENAETEKTLAEIFRIGQFPASPINMYDVLQIVVLGILAVLCLGILYLIFLHKYKVTYICDDEAHTVEKKEKRYRFRKAAHVYHQHVLDGKVDGMYSDKAMQLLFLDEFPMPLNNVKVYVHLEPKTEPEATENAEKETATVS
ncbi:MAG TPA: hypothetical protein DDY98_03285 [Ruminococcaceae bacterium]|nr:hypothetical protein [Oscillospiraceae bacterium]